MEELKFLMWNIKKKGKVFKDAIKEVIDTYKPDILLLTETDLQDKDI